MARSPSASAGVGGGLHALRGRGPSGPLQTRSGFRPARSAAAVRLRPGAVLIAAAVTLVDPGAAERPVHFSSKSRRSTPRYPRAREGQTSPAAHAARGSRGAGPPLVLLCRDPGSACCCALIERGWDPPVVERSPHDLAYARRRTGVKPNLDHGRSDSLHVAGVRRFQRCTSLLEGVRSVLADPAAEPHDVRALGLRGSSLDP
jgi:hypothetical protein